MGNRMMPAQLSQIGKQVATEMALVFRVRCLTPGCLSTLMLQGQRDDLLKLMEIRFVNSMQYVSIIEFQEPGCVTLISLYALMQQALQRIQHTKLLQKVRV